MGSRLKSAKFFLENRVHDAARGDLNACYELGIVYSTGTAGVGVNLVEAHKWFNLAAVRGHASAQDSRSEIADFMTAREIAEAQRAARALIGAAARA